MSPVEIAAVAADPFADLFVDLAAELDWEDAVEEMALIDDDGTTGVLACL
jgi:hypothetical protein